MGKSREGEGRDTMELSRNRKEFSITGVYKVEYKEREQELGGMGSESIEIIPAISSLDKQTESINDPR